MILSREIFENSEDVEKTFAELFSDFVNGYCHDKKKVAELMSRDHRYLQNEMFKIFVEYVKILAKNYENRFYDGRNEWACETAKKFVDAAEIL